MSVEQLYHNTSRLVREIEAALSRAEATSPEAAPAAEAEAQALIDRCCSDCDRLDILVSKQPPGRRQQAKIRADQLRHDCQHMQASLRQLQYKRASREQEQQEREALLRTSFAPNDSTSVLIDHSLQHNESLHTANRYIDDMLSQGRSVLSNLSDQRSVLKRAHKGMLSVLNTLGLSNSVMRLIERRGAQDKAIFAIGCCVTLLIMYLVWRHYA